jgi:hypothetical protein
MRIIILAADSIIVAHSIYIQSSQQDFIIYAMQIQADIS